MQINHIETTKRCQVLNKKALGRELGCSDVLVKQVIEGTYQFMHAELARKVIDRVRELGLLVEDDDERIAV